MGLVYKSLEGPQELPAFEVSSGIRFIKAEFLDFSLEKVKSFSTTGERKCRPIAVINKSACVGL